MTESMIAYQVVAALSGAFSASWAGDDPYCWRLHTSRQDVFAKN
jgi:hypothetical protein